MQNNLANGTNFYFLPRDKYFKIVFVFGQRATEIILKSQILDDIKMELDSAKVSAEGCGTRININEKPF